MEEKAKLEKTITDFNKKKIKNFKREGNVYLVDFGNFKFTAARTLVKKRKGHSTSFDQDLFPRQARGCKEPTVGWWMDLHKG